MNLIGTLYDVFNALGQQLVELVPKLIIAMILLFIGWIIARVISMVILRLLVAVNIAALDKKISEIDIFSSMNVDLAKLLSNFIYWLIMLIFITKAADIVGLTAVSVAIASIVSYLPKLISALIFFVAGSFVASIIQQVTASAFASMGIAAGRIVSSFVFYLLLVLVAITALNQAGVDTAIITQNLTVMLAAIFFAFAVAYGFGSRDIMSNLLASFYSKDKFSVGQTIRVDGVQGVIVRLDSTAVTLNAGDKEILLPLHKLITSTVEILK